MESEEIPIAEKQMQDAEERRRLFANLYESALNLQLTQAEQAKLLHNFKKDLEEAGKLIDSILERSSQKTLKRMVKAEGELAPIQVLAIRPTNRERLMQTLSVALADRSWLTTYTATDPLEITVMLRGGLTPEELASSLIENKPTLDIDLSEVITGDTPPMERLVFLAVYPSGRCRAVITEPIQEDKRVILRLPDPLVLIDPDMKLQKVPEGGLELSVELIGMEVPCYVG